jgi:5-methylcytosine-specific restriction endonuclease McrA
MMFFHGEAQQQKKLFNNLSKVSIMAMKAGVRGSVRKAIFKRDHFTCLICNIKGFKLKHKKCSTTYPTSIPRVYLSIDHIIPRAKNGSSDASNLRCLCMRCNSKKGIRSK